MLRNTMRIALILCLTCLLLGCTSVSEKPKTLEGMIFFGQHGAHFQECHDGNEGRITELDTISLAWADGVDDVLPKIGNKDVCGLRAHGFSLCPPITMPVIVKGRYVKADDTSETFRFEDVRPHPSNPCLKL